MKKIDFLFLFFLIVVVVLLAISIHKNNISILECSNYERLEQNYKSKLNNLEHERYYLVMNYCHLRNYSNGYIPLDGLKENYLILQCIDCDNNTCNKIDSFELK